MRAKEFDIKKRDPNWRAMQDIRRSGAGGQHKDKKKATKQGEVKHKAKQFAEGVSEGYTTEKQIMTRIRQIMHDRKLSGTESNAGELHRLKQQLKDLRSQQGVEEGIGGTIIGGVGQFFGNKIDPLAGEIMRAHGEIAGRKAEYTIRKYMNLLQKALKQQLDSGGKNDEGMQEGSYTTEKQILTRIRQIMYDRKLSGTESNAGELNRLKQQLKDIRSQQDVAEGFFSIDDKIKGKIQNIVSDLSDIPGMWDHKAQTFTDAGMDKLKVVLKNNPKYIKYAINLTADDFDESVEEGWGQREFEVDGYTYMTDIDEEEDNRKIWHMLKTPEGKTIDIDFTPYSYMTKDDVELYIKLGMPKRQGVGPLDSEKLQKMAQIKGVAMLDPKMARAGM